MTIRPPARVGQIIRDAFICIELRVTAFIMSSPWTKRRIIACRAGLVSAIVMPKRIEEA